MMEAKVNICSMPGCQTTAGCICDRVLANRNADQQEIMRINNSLRETLLAIKAICAGDRAPNWIEDGYRVTVTRGRIMDLVDGVVR
jgi:hypothetical protein